MLQRKLLGTAVTPYIITILNHLIFSTQGSSTSQLSSPYDYSGGAPLRVEGSCPSGTVTCKIPEGNLLGICCGAGQTCILDSGGSYCCPDDKPCVNTVVNGRKCADPSWELCNEGPVGNGVGFCCQENYVCFERGLGTALPGMYTDYAQRCSTPGYSVATEKGEIKLWTMFAANAGPDATTTTTHLKASTATALSSSIRTPSMTVTPSKNSHSASGMSSGGIAGLVIGCVIIAISCTLTVVWYRGRNQVGMAAAKIPPEMMGQHVETSADHRWQLEGREVILAHEAGSHAINELGDNRSP